MGQEVDAVEEARRSWHRNKVRTINPKLKFHLKKTISVFGGNRKLFLKRINSEFPFFYQIFAPLKKNPTFKDSQYDICTYS